MLRRKFSRPQLLRFTANLRVRVKIADSPNLVSAPVQLYAVIKKLWGKLWGVWVIVWGVSAVESGNEWKSLISKTRMNTS